MFPDGNDTEVGERYKFFTLEIENIRQKLECSFSEAFCCQAARGREYVLPGQILQSNTYQYYQYQYQYYNTKHP